MADDVLSKEHPFLVGDLLSLRIEDSIVQVRITGVRPGGLLDFELISEDDIGVLKEGDKGCIEKEDELSG